MRSDLVDFFAKDSVLLVFVVMAVAAAVGAVRLKSVALGPAAALFAGLGIGAIDEKFSAASGLGVLRQLGLVLFAYTLGLAAGPAFIAGLRRGGGRAAALTAALIGVLAAGCAVAAQLLDLPAADRAGLFAGSTTNTPALQAATEAVSHGNPVVAYSLTYPTAVAAMLVVSTLLLGRRLPLPARLTPPPPEPRTQRIVSWTVQINAAGLPTIGELGRDYPRIAFSRIEHDGTVTIAGSADRLTPGDSIVAIGPEPAVEAFAAAVGERSDRHLPLDRSVLDFRRIVVSNRRMAGRSLGALDLIRRFGVTVTRVRRGDDDLLANGALELQLGDRVRVVGPTEQIDNVARLFGDSERRLAEVDPIGFAVGIAAGLLLGAISVPLPGDIDLKLGAGGGPLIVGLILGHFTRTGRVTWQIGHGANVVLRQLGILMFLACAGLGSGTAFADAVGTRRGVELVIAGLVISMLFAGAIPLATAVVLRRNILDSAGMLAGVETQPAALAYIYERVGGDERVNHAYTLVFPVAMIAKILIVQFLA
ncbi:MAG TPA: TrkA C-terminal domain-containing protein [Ilumatobacteraceae bacterium]|jgi:putative transport protein